MDLPSTMPNDIVMLQGLHSSHGPQDCVVRMGARLEDEKVDFYVQEPSYNNDARHLDEVINGWLIGEAGAHCMDHGTSIQNCDTDRILQMGSKEVGGKDGATRGIADACIQDGWVSVEFEEAFGSMPIVVANMMTVDNIWYSTVRIKETTQFGFKMIIAQQDKDTGDAFSDGLRDANNNIVTEKVAWLAVP